MTTPSNIKTLIPATHFDADSAFYIADYPYGFTLRCVMRVWVEYRAGHGYRYVTQTSNPKKPGLVWNKPKASTYCMWPIALYIDQNDHVQHTSVPSYCENLATYRDWLASYGAAIDGRDRFRLDCMVAKLTHAANPIEGKTLYQYIKEGI